jgi:hypothetical protein
MPIEIKELIIKAIISPNVSSEKRNLSEKAITVKELIKLKNEIKEECLKQMKEFLKDQKER